MRINERGLDIIRKTEGLRLKAYLCPAGIPTIGYGHTSGVKLGQSCTRAQAEAWLIEDSSLAGKCVERSCKAPLSENQFSALVSFVFNLGCGAFSKSTLLKKLNARDYEGAASEFPRWNKDDKGKPLKGLTSRRAMEKALFVTV